MIDEGDHIVARGDETPLFRMPGIQRKQGTAITTAGRSHSTASTCAPQGSRRHRFATIAITWASSTRVAASGARGPRRAQPQPAFRGPAAPRKQGRPHDAPGALLVATSGSRGPDWGRTVRVLRFALGTTPPARARRREAAAPIVPLAAAASGAARWTDVGLFVGLFCQPASGLERFIAVDSRAPKSAESPVTTGSSRKTSDAGGGTRTPDTRIMIPLL
jgi:hypothetical protein